MWVHDDWGYRAVGAGSVKAAARQSLALPMRMDRTPSRRSEIGVLATLAKVRGPSIRQLPDSGCRNGASVEDRDVVESWSTRTYLRA
jgi:hypothetical protein